MGRKVLFLRKKVKGQNSMEELAKSLKSALKDIEVIELPYYSTSLVGMIKNGVWAKKRQGDINHIFSITEGYLSLFLSGKKVITIHDLYFHQFSFLSRVIIYLFWLIIPSFFTNRYTCISNLTKKKLLRIMPWVKKKVEVIYNPLSKDYYQLYEQVSNSKPVILHIGTALHKNLQNVIEAVSSLTCKLIIVGKLFPNQMKRLIENEIDFENSWDISREQLINLYKQADVVSFPSSQEGFGMIVIEANAMGKAVVAGDIPVLHEVGNNAALFVDPNDIVAIRNGFKILIENSMTRETYIKAGRINAQRFQLEAIAKKYNRVYEYLSKNKSFIN